MRGSRQSVAVQSFVDLLVIIYKLWHEESSFLSFLQVHITWIWRKFQCAILVSVSFGGNPHSVMRKYKDNFQTKGEDNKKVISKRVLSVDLKNTLLGKVTKLTVFRFILYWMEFIAIFILFSFTSLTYPSNVWLALLSVFFGYFIEWVKRNERREKIRRSKDNIRYTT